MLAKELPWLTEDRVGAQTRSKAMKAAINRFSMRSRRSVQRWKQHIHNVLHNTGRRMIVGRRILWSFHIPNASELVRTTKACSQTSLPPSICLLLPWTMEGQLPRNAAQSTGRGVKNVMLATWCVGRKLFWRTEPMVDLWMINLLEFASPLSKEWSKMTKVAADVPSADAPSANRGSTVARKMPRPFHSPKYVSLLSSATAAAAAAAAPASVCNDQVDVVAIAQSVGEEAIERKGEHWQRISGTNLKAFLLLLLKEGISPWFVAENALSMTDGLSRYRLAPYQWQFMVAEALLPFIRSSPRPHSNEQYP